MNFRHRNQFSSHNLLEGDREDLLLLSSSSSSSLSDPEIAPLSAVDCRLLPAVLKVLFFEETLLEDLVLLELLVLLDENLLLGDK